MKKIYFPLILMLMVTFTICTLPIIKAQNLPIKYTPEDQSETTDTTPLFTWSQVPEADYYELFIDSTFYTTTSTSFTPDTLLSYGIHTWSVKAWITGEPGVAWGSTWTFEIIEPASTTTPSEISPWVVVMSIVVISGIIGSIVYLKKR